MKIGNAPEIGAFGFPFGAVTTIIINDAKALEGVSFGISKRLIVPVNPTPVYIVIDPTEIDAEKTLVILPVAISAIGGGPIFVDLFVGTDSDDDGTVWGSVNRNHNSSNTAQTVVRLNPTINNIGTQTPSEFMIPSDGQAAATKVGGESRDDSVFFPVKSQKYTFRLINQSNNQADAVMGFTFFEAIS